MSQSRNLNPSIYFIVDPSLCGGREVYEIVRAAVQGGASLIQYRDKENSAPIILRHVKLIQQELAQYHKEAGRHVPLIINDYVELAKEVNADGVHLGQGDMNPEEARKILGPDKIIGVTAFTAKQINAIDPAIVDYIGTGPFYPTKTEKGKPVLGPEKFAALAALSPVPIVGIGGITPENAVAVMAAGADGVAMMRSISEADNPQKTAENFVRAIKC